MNINYRNDFGKYFLVFIFLLASIGFGYRCFWYVVSPGGDIGLDNTGTTAGQTAIGTVSGSATHGEGTYGFWYQNFNPTICFDIAGSEPYEWVLDTIDLSTTHAMELGDQFILSNCGNCNLAFSLEWISSSPGLWVYGYSNDVDRFVTRAQFTQTAEEPSVYNHSRDYINDIRSWSTEEQFGPAGYNMAVGENEYLWLEFVAPFYLSDETDYNIVDTLTYELTARANLP